MNNLFSRWKDGLSRTSKAAFGQIASVLGTSEITADTWDDLEALLLQADLGIETTASVLDSLKRAARAEGLIRANELSVSLRQELRARLDDLGLKAAATHIGTANLHPDKIQQAIEFHQEIGCKYLIVPMDGDFTKPDKSKALADVFNAAAATLKPHGMGCGYHNHKQEFEKTGDSNHWEIFAGRTSKDVILQIDFGWTAAAKQDGPDLVKRHPGRMSVVHLKPTVVDKEPGKKALLGQDSVDWPPILKALKESGGTQWLTLEQEAYPDGKTPMECTALSYEALRKLV